MLLLGREELGVGALLRRRRRLAGERQRLGRQVELGACGAARPRARISTSPSASLSSASTICTRRPGRTTRASTATGADRHRAQDLEGDPADLELLGLRQPLDLAAEQRRGRPGVLGARVPGPAGQLGGAEAVAVGLVEGVGHAAHPRRELRISSAAWLPNSWVQTWAPPLPSRSPTRRPMPMSS